MPDVSDTPIVIVQDMSKDDTGTQRMTVTPTIADDNRRK
jgi:hypothetical protein